MLEQTLCLVCIREKGMKRIERTFNSSGIWVSILKRRYNTLFPTNNANVGPNFESRNLILITRDWTTCDLRWGEVGVGTRSYNSKINGDWCASYYKYSNLLLIQNFLVLYSVQYYYYYAICGSILGMLTLVSWTLQSTSSERRAAWAVSSGRSFLYYVTCWSDGWVEIVIRIWKFCVQVTTKYEHLDYRKMCN